MMRVLCARVSVGMTASSRAQGMLLVACLTSTSEYDRQRRKPTPPRLGIQRGVTEGEQAYSGLT